MNLTDMIYYMILNVGAHIKTSRIGMQRQSKHEKVFAKKRTNGLRYVMIKMHGIIC